MKLFKNVVIYFNNLHVRRKLILLYAIIGTVPILCLGIFLIINTTNLAYKMHVSQVQEENKRVKLIIFDSIYLANNISDIILQDENIRPLISTQYKDDSEVYKAYKSYNLLNTMLSNHYEISSINVYVNNKTMVSNGNFKMVDNSIVKSDWYKKASASKGEKMWMINTTPGQDGNLWLVQKFFSDKTENSAVLIICISNNYLNLMVKDTPFHTLVELDGDRIIYSENYDEIGKHLLIGKKWSNTMIPQSGMLRYNGIDSLAFSSILSSNNNLNYFQIVTIDNDGLKVINEVTFILLFIVLISLVLPIIMMLIFSNIFSKRIVTLRSEMHKIAGGDFSIIEEFSGNDELGEFFSDMKLTLESIKNLSMEIYNGEISKKKLIIEQQKMKFEMLSTQIKPHFLFNTLESIRMKAFNNGEIEIAKIIKLLGKSMRHVLDVKDGLVTLESELEYIRIYIDIQMFRFGGKISYEINIDENVHLDRYLILPLLIQPVVENAIVHGIEAKDGDGWVKISIEERQSRLFVVISDNGIGMSDEKREELLDNTNSSTSKFGIGLQNIQQRIKLFYGIQYNIYIKSKQGEGTSITICLPSDWRETI